jgi:hypothetical protein
VRWGGLETTKVSKIPRRFKIVSMMALGYYEKRPSKEKKRKTLQDIAWFNKIK